MDIKFIGSGPSTKAVIYYITDYITKSQLKTHVAFAALELAVKKLNDNENEYDLATTRAKRLLQKCAYAMVSHQELSAQQVCSYLMDFEDHFTSHEYRNIFWKSFEIYVDWVLPLIAPDDSESHTEETNGDCTDHFENDDQGEPEEGDEVGVTTNIAGEIVPKNGQVLDYMRRGDALRQISLWEYVAGIHKLTKKRVSNGNENGTYLNNVADSEVQAAWNTTSFTHAKYPFSESHPDHDSHIQQINRPDKRFIPVPIGPPLPRHDQEDNMACYHRLMLILFKPWSDPSDLVYSADSIDIKCALRTAFENMVHASPQVAKYLDNMQALHECKDSRDDHFQSRQQKRSHNTDTHEATQREVCDDFVFGNAEQIGDEILDHINDAECARSNAISNSASDAIACVRAAEHAGMFQSENVMVTDSASNHHMETTDQALEKIWANEYEQYKTNWRSSLINSHPQSGTSRAEHHTASVSVQNVHQGRDDVHMADSYQHEQSCSIHIASTPTDTLTIPNELDVTESLITEFTLNKEQTQAFSMVAEHSCRDKPEQLQMFLGGPGGTGKSQVINALCTFFQRKREDRRFRLAAYTGVATHNIQGMTLHAALGLNQQRKGNSSRVTQDLIAMWRGVDYLFIDEVSMIGCKFLFKLHEALCVAKEDKRPFGGINIIFTGDFAQSPVGDTRFCSKLNTRRKATNAGQNEMFGKLLWLSVDKCVMLKNIMRQRGPENQPFIQLLQRLRTGQCNEDDYELLNSKLLCNAEPLWSQEEWRESPVIVSNNEAKDLINLKCAEAFAARTGHELHYHALDRQGGKVIDHADLKEHLKSLHTGNTVQRAGLLPLVIGMPVMICANFDIPNGVVNGSIGILKEVRYTTDQNNHRHAAYTHALYHYLYLAGPHCSTST